VAAATPLTLIALSKVDDKNAGLASGLVNIGHVAGGLGQARGQFGFQCSFQDCFH